MLKQASSDSSIDRSMTLMDKMKNKMKFNPQKVFNIINDPETSFYPREKEDVFKDD